MLYTCQTKCCHYVFIGSKQQTACPDCGKKHIRPATPAERAAYFRRQTALLTGKQRLG